MIKNKKKLRLRKEVIISIPISLCVATFLTILIITNNKALSVKTTPKVVESSYTVNELTEEGKAKIEGFINYLENAHEKRVKDNTIIYYAQKFKLNVSKTLQIAHELTNNYEDEEYNKTFTIAPDSYKAKVGTFNSMEAGMVYFVRDLYRYPNRYGTTIEEIRTSEEPDQTKIIVDGTTYLKNGFTYEQYLGHICDLYGIDKSIALAISYHESGILKSGLFMKSNNVGGMRGYAGWMKFPTLEAGIIGYVISLRAIINNNGINLNAPNGISDLSSIYVNGHPNNPSDHWTSKVTYFRNKINEKDLFTIN